MNTTASGEEPRQQVPDGHPKTTLPPDDARQGEIVFGKPWKRQVFFAVVAAVAVIGLILIVTFT